MCEEASTVLVILLQPCFISVCWLVCLCAAGFGRYRKYGTHYAGWTINERVFSCFKIGVYHLSKGNYVSDVCCHYRDKNKKYE
jgi:hypothetical protein